VNWIEKISPLWRGVPLDVRLKHSERLKLDMLCTIDNFVYHQEKNNDIKFQIDFREYKKPPVNIAASQASEGVIE
jgi:hypothetical protein